MDRIGYVFPVHRTKKSPNRSLGSYASQVSYQIAHSKAQDRVLRALELRCLEVCQNHTS